MFSRQQSSLGRVSGWKVTTNDLQICFIIVHWPGYEEMNIMLDVKKTWCDVKRKARDQRKGPARKCNKRLLCDGSLLSGLQTAFASY